MKYWLFRLLFRKELKRLAAVDLPNLNKLLAHRGPGAPHDVMADLFTMAGAAHAQDVAVEALRRAVVQVAKAEQRAAELEATQRAHVAINDGLQSGNASAQRQLLALWARAHPWLPEAVRAEFKDLGLPEKSLATFTLEYEKALAQKRSRDARDFLANL